MNHQQGFVIGVSGGGAPVEAACDHSFVVDYGELVMQLVAACQVWSADSLEGILKRVVAGF